MNPVSSRRLARRMILVSIGLAVLSFMSYGTDTRQQVNVAVAKGKQLYDMAYMAPHRLDLAEVDRALAANREVVQLLASGNLDLVGVTPLGLGDSRPWASDGCGLNTCAMATYYDFSQGGVLNFIIHLEQDRVVDWWAEPGSRPAGSSQVLSRAMRIASEDMVVRAILGDIGEPDPAMIPMSGWLVGDACHMSWCVDLTYQDPAGSGRIFHIFVDLENEEVSRTFFTRGRPERSLGKPLSQRDAYRDGCHDQYGWNVCWEMTAHDGINFRDASYNGRLIFSSVKLTQIEAWYPSWPGGYRDEIGYSASVPAFGGTDVIDLSNGFEVRQLFTEFTHWPNCICCYRYEQIIRLFADGSFEFDFVSHGPGCDDIPFYRPFWRIDLDLDGPDDDEVWYWNVNEWQEATEEVELPDFVTDLSPDGAKLATIDGDVSYRWRPLPTDPLGRDESHVFVLRKKELEGDGPVLPGPGDTFIPPRQWINGDQASGNDIVLWYVPTLKQLMGEPWWCMPDPEPDFNPCNAILRVEPAGELEQPTAEELLQLTVTPQATRGISTTETAEAVPAETFTPAPTATPRPLQGEDAETIIMGAGCGSCHKIGDMGEAHKVGPDLSNIGNLASQRVPGLTGEEYLRQSILDPNAFFAQNCPNGPCLPNIMPADYGRRLTEGQVDVLISFLLEQRQEITEVTVIGAEGAPDATAVPKAFPSPKRALSRSADNTALLAIQLLLVVIVLLFSVFRLFVRPRE